MMMNLQKTRLAVVALAASCLVVGGLTGCNNDDLDRYNGTSNSSSQDAGDDDAGGDDAGDDVGGGDAANDVGQDTGRDASQRPCEPNPCANEGVCHEQDDGYVCECADGFWGEHCENEVGGREGFDPHCDEEDVCTMAGRVYDEADPDNPTEQVELLEGGEVVDTAEVDEHGFYAFENAPRRVIEKSADDYPDEEEPEFGPCGPTCDGACVRDKCLPYLDGIEAEACLMNKEDESELCWDGVSGGGNGDTPPDFEHTAFYLDDNAESSNPLEVITEAKITGLKDKKHDKRRLAIADNADAEAVTIDGVLERNDGEALPTDVSVNVVDVSGAEPEVVRTARVDGDTGEFALEQIPLGNYEVEVRAAEMGGESITVAFDRFKRVEAILGGDDEDDWNPIDMDTIGGPGPYDPTQ